MTALGHTGGYQSLGEKQVIGLQSDIVETGSTICAEQTEVSVDGGRVKNVAGNRVETTVAGSIQSHVDGGPFERQTKRVVFGRINRRVH